MGILSNGLLQIVAAVALFGGVLVFAHAFFGWADERIEARQSLKTLDDYDNELVKKLRRLRNSDGKSLGQQLVDMGRKVTKPDLQAKTRSKLALAGRPSKDDLDRYLATRLLCLFGAVVWVALFLLVIPVFHGPLKVLVAALGGFGLYKYPDIQVDRWKEARQKSLFRTMPDVLDILCLSVEAGLGFEQAVAQVVENVPGPLSDEFFRALTETRAGSSRAEALRAMDERCGVPELKSFVLAIVQADQFGISIAGILRAQAEEMRIKRRQYAQEKAQKLPVKMLLPMTFCIFPALMVVLIGPAAINTMNNIH